MIPLIATEKEKFTVNEDLAVKLHPMDGERETGLLEVYSQGEELKAVEWANKIIDLFVCEIIYKKKVLDMGDRSPSQIMRLKEKNLIVDHIMQIQKGLNAEDKKK